MKIGYLEVFFIVMVKHSLYESNIICYLCITCKVPITGIKIDVCLILLSLANKGNPPAFLIFCLFRVDLDNDQRANAAPLATWKRNARH